GTVRSEKNKTENQGPWKMTLRSWILGFLVPATLAFAQGTEFQITTAELPPAQIGQSYVAAVTTNSSLPSNFNAIGLPAGLTIDSKTGVISGIPTVPGTYQVTLIAENGQLGATTKTLPLIVQGGLTIITPSLAQGSTGKAYSAMIEAAGGVT